jgi:four helix bundle protein
MEQGASKPRAKLFRFEDLEVWKRAADVGFEICDIADGLEHQKRYRYAEQLRAAALSISNNIAEGSGSNSNNEFRQFLNFARRSAFECANMLLMFERQRFVSRERMQPLLMELNEVCQMITGFSRSLA